MTATATGEPQPPRSLRESAAAGARWTTGATVVSFVGQFGQLAVLARLLDPRDFGLAASAMVIIGLASTLAEAGITNAIITRQTSDRDVLSSLYWANLLIGVCVALLVVASIPVATAVFGEPGIGTLLLLAAPASVIAPLGQQFSALLSKDLRFKPLAFIEAGSVIGGVVAAIVLAYAGAGAASFIGGFLTQAALRSAALAVRGWATAPPRMRLRRADLAGYLAFGGWQMGERTLTYVGSNLDYILIGALLGPRLLGIYSVAFRLITIPQLRLNPILTRAAFPVFAKRRDDDAALRRGFLELSQLIGFIALPIMVAFAVTAPQLVPVVYGPRWAESVPVLQVLSIAGALFALGNPNGIIFLAKGRPDLGLKINAMRFCLLLVALGLAVQGGLIAVAWAFVGVLCFNFVVTRLVLRRVIGLTATEYFSGLRLPGLVAVGMGLAVLVVTPALRDLVEGEAAVLVGQLAVAALALGGLVRLLAGEWAARTWRLVVKGAM